MFVKPVHRSLRDEIIESGFLSLAKWNKFVDLKARKFEGTEAVKKLTARRAGGPYGGTFTGRLLVMEMIAH